MIGVFILGGLVVVQAVLIVALIVTRDRSSVRRGEYRRMKAEHALAVDALEKLDAAADCIRDLGDPSAVLAAQVRATVRTFRTERTKIT